MQGASNQTSRKNVKINLRAMGPDDKRDHPESSYNPLNYELGSNRGRRQLTKIPSGYHTLVFDLVPPIGGISQFYT